MRWLPRAVRWQWPTAVALVGVVLVLLLGRELMPSAQLAACDSEHARSVVRTYFASKHDDPTVMLGGVAESDVQTQGDRVALRRCHASVLVAGRQIAVNYTVSPGKPGASAVHVEDPDIVAPDQQ